METPSLPMTDAERRMHMRRLMVLVPLLLLALVLFGFAFVRRAQALAGLQRDLDRLAVLQPFVADLRSFKTIPEEKVNAIKTSIANALEVRFDASKQQMVLAVSVKPEDVDVGVSLRDKTTKQDTPVAGFILDAKTGEAVGIERF